MAATVPSLIRFRLLAAQLSSSEFNQFLIKLVAECGRNVILTPLFHAFSKGGSDCFDAATLDDTCSIMTNIITNREFGEQKNQEGPTKALQSIPRDLIGEVASYLDQYEFVHFSHCCRSTYAGCQSPITLRELDLIGVRDYSAVDLSKFVNLHKLRLSLCKWNELSFPIGGQVCSRLKRLCIDHGSAGDTDSVVLGQFMASNAIDFEQITHLKLSNFGILGLRFEADTFLRILSKFPSLEYLWLWCVYLNRYNAEVKSNIINQLKHLRSFGVNGCITAMTRDILSGCCGTLKALSTPLKIGILNDTKLDNLEEIIIEAYCKYINKRLLIQSNMSNLKRVDLKFAQSHISIAESFLNGITNVMSNQKHLEKFVVTLPVNQVDNVCKALSRGMYDNAEGAVMDIVIQFVVAWDTKEELSNVMHNISGLLDRLTLRTLHTGNFVFQWVIHWNSVFAPDTNEWSDHMNELQKKHSLNLDIMRGTHDFAMFVFRKASRRSRDLIYISESNEWISSQYRTFHA